MNIQSNHLFYFPPSRSTLSTLPTLVFPHAFHFHFLFLNPAVHSHNLFTPAFLLTFLSFSSLINVGTFLPPLIRTDILTRVLLLLSFFFRDCLFVMILMNSTNDACFSLMWAAYIQNSHLQRFWQNRHLRFDFFFEKYHDSQQSDCTVLIRVYSYDSPPRPTSSYGGTARGNGAHEKHRQDRYI